MNTYDWSQFHVHMYYPAPLAEVFARFSTARGLESFFIHKAVHTGAGDNPRAADEIVCTGDSYHWSYVHDFAHGGTYKSVIPDQLVSFTFGSMLVEINFSTIGEYTLVDLHQSNCATTDPDRAWQHLNCRSCWIYFFTNLRSVLMGGLDLRDYEHPDWNDSVSIGYKAKA